MARAGGADREAGRVVIRRRRALALGLAAAVASPARAQTPAAHRAWWAARSRRSSMRWVREPPGGRRFHESLSRGGAGAAAGRLHACAVGRRRAGAEADADHGDHGGRSGRDARPAALDRRRTHWSCPTSTITATAVIAKIAAVGEGHGQGRGSGRNDRAAAAPMQALSRGSPRRPASRVFLFLLSMGGGAPPGRAATPPAPTASSGWPAVPTPSTAIPLPAAHTKSVIASRADFVLVTRQTVEAMGGIEAILDQPALRRTPAGRDGKVLQFDTLLLLGFGPRTPQAATELAAALHPELARAP